MCCLKIERTHDITTYLGWCLSQVTTVLSIDSQLFVVPEIPLQVIPTWSPSWYWLAITTQVIAWCLCQTGSSLPSLGRHMPSASWVEHPTRLLEQALFFKTSLQRCATGWACQSTHTSTELNLLTSNFTLLACIHAVQLKVSTLYAYISFFAAKSTSSSQLKQNCPDQMNISRNTLFLLITILNLLLSRVSWGCNFSLALIPPKFGPQKGIRMFFGKAKGRGNCDPPSFDAITLIFLSSWIKLCISSWHCSELAAKHPCQLF